MFYSVPYLKFDSVRSKVDYFWTELDSDGGIMVELELFLYEVEKNAALTNA